MRLVIGLLVGTFALAATAHASPKSEAKTIAALAALELNDTARAEALLNEAIKLDPADTEAQYHLGRVFLQAGDLPRATAQLEKAVRGGYPNALALGVAYFRAGRTAAAEKSLRASLKYQVKQPEAHYYLGLVQMRQTRYPQAANSFLAAREDETLQSQADYQRGLALHKAGDTAAAVEILAAVATAGDPSIAGEAQALLNKLQPPKAWRLRADLVHQFDSNVILAQTDRSIAAGMYDPEEISNRNGQRFALTLGGDYTFQIDKGSRVAVGYTGYQSYHRTNREILQRYDVSAHTLSLRGEHQQGKWLASLGLAGNASILGPVAGARDYAGETPEAAGYSRSLAAAPLVLRSLTKTQGVGLGYTFRLERFAVEGAEIPSNGGVLRTDRGNASHGLDVLYLWRFADKGFFTPSAGVFMSDARGADNIWDHQGAKVQLRGAAPLVAGLSAGAVVAASARNYATEYPVAGAAVTSLEKRGDRELTGGINLQWEYNGLRTQAGVFGQRNRSTIGEYDYSRLVYSVGLGTDL